MCGVQMTILRRYISADFVNHPTSDLALSLLKKHNVELFEVCGGECCFGCVVAHDFEELAFR